MAHHSSEQFKPKFPEELLEFAKSQDDKQFGEIIQELISQHENFGATGQFPQGKIIPEDEGEIRLGISNYKGKIIMNFGKAVAWIGFDAEQARDLAKTLIKHADQVNPQ